MIAIKRLLIVIDYRGHTLSMHYGVISWRIQIELSSRSGPRGKNAARSHIKYIQRFILLLTIPFGGICAH
jgi:hypothetical protein